jgi:ATP-dependent exoDNAse (exonuclease V) alpha subunit
MSRFGRLGHGSVEITEVRRQR